jgi:trehalose-6-phosphate synthase
MIIALSRLLKSVPRTEIETVDVKITVSTRGDVSRIDDRIGKVIEEAVRGHLGRGGRSRG